MSIEKNVEQDKNILKNFRPYSASLKKMIFYLVHNQKILSKYTLIRAYKFMQDKSYAYMNYTCAHHLHAYYKSNVPDWSWHDNGYMNDCKSLSIKRGIKQGKYSVDIDTKYFTIRNGATDQRTPSDFRSDLIKLNQSDKHPFVYVLINGRPNYNSKDIVALFTGFVVAIKSVVDQIIAKSDHDLIKLYAQSRKLDQDIHQQKEALRKSPYNWEKVFGSNK